MNKFRVIMIIFAVIPMALILLLMIVAVTNEATKKEIGTERIKCIDDVGAEFIDEWCDKDIYCTWLGWGSSEKCKDVKEKLG